MGSNSLGEHENLSIYTNVFASFRSIPLSRPRGIKTRPTSPIDYPYSKRSPITPVTITASASLGPSGLDWYMNRQIK